jgi:hypothetical protein
VHRLTHLALTLPLVLVLCGIAAAEEPAAAPDESAKAGRAELRAKLDGTRWAIELQPMYGRKLEQPITDTLSFEYGQFASERLTSQGFPASDVTVGEGEDGTPFWEVTQLNRQEGIIFWRGELEADAVRGLLSRHPLAGRSEEYVFMGRPIPQRQETP